jgi:hypothetical protein
MRRLLVSGCLACVVVLTLPPGAAGWTPDGTALCTAANDQIDPVIASDGGGGAIVAWEDHRVVDGIYVQRVDAAGAPLWAIDGVPLCTAPGGQSAPAIVSDGTGGAIVAWADSRGLASHIYAQRVSGSGAPLWTADGVALAGSGPGPSQTRPQIVSDGANGAIVIWSEWRPTTLDDLYAQRVNGAGIPLWSPGAVPLCAAASTQHHVTVASDGAGGVIVVWEDWRTAKDIYARRVDAAGTPLWTVDGVALCTAGGAQNPEAITDGVGGAIVTWEDFRSGLGDVYAQRVDAVGTPLWTQNGVGLCTHASNQRSPVISTDATGGAIVIWDDYRSGGSSLSDVYGRRVDASGTALWTVDGVAICTAILNQSRSAAVLDGAGGVIVPWYDDRAGGFQVWDIYTRRVSASGMPLGGPNGIPICTALNDQVDAASVPSGAGGAILVWEDYRSGQSDIYAHRVPSFPAVSAPTIESGPPVFLVALPPYPNPLRGTATLALGLPKAASVHIEVFDAAGRRVSSRPPQELQQGWQRVELVARDDTGKQFPAGVYFYRVRAAGEVATGKMTVTR